MSGIRIELDDPRRGHSVELLKRHLEFTASVPPGIRHALDVEGLAVPSISFWTFWDQQAPIACAAIKALDEQAGEIKSMHVLAERRGQGIADLIMAHLIDVARERGYAALSLETGSTEGYVPARRLYARHGFVECPPFADYSEDPASTYMSLRLHRSDVSPESLEFRLDDPASDHAVGLLDAHLAHAYASSPPESVFALDRTGLAAPGIEFWTVWDGDFCAGCGALREIDPGEFELKSMHTAEQHRGRGVGASMLNFLVQRARERGGHLVLLETGSNQAYAPARRMYARHGFAERGIFKGYEEDPLSTYMELRIS